MHSKNNNALLNYKNIKFLVINHSNIDLIDLEIKRLNALKKPLVNSIDRLKNNLSNATVKISDGKLKFTNTKVQEPLTFKYLEKTLGEVIKNESQVKLIMEHLKQKRSIKIVPEIKRFSNN